MKDANKNIIKCRRAFNSTERFQLLFLLYVLRASLEQAIRRRSWGNDEPGAGRGQWVGGASPRSTATPPGQSPGAAGSPIGSQHLNPNRPGADALSVDKLYRVRSRLYRTQIEYPRSGCSSDLLSAGAAALQNSAAAFEVGPSLLNRGAGVSRSSGSG